MQLTILMKVARILTSKLLVYYSLKGNTKGIIDKLSVNNYDIVDINKNRNIDFEKYETILIGTSTYGRGVPPQPFWGITDRLRNLKGKKIGLFGSGRSEYEFFCGALDLLEDLVKQKNKILFKYKFEGYPRESDVIKFKELMEEIEYESNQI